MKRIKIILVMALIIFSAINLSAQEKKNLLTLFGSKDKTPPSLMTNLAAIGSPSAITITSDANTTGDFSKWVLYRNTSNDTTTASAIDSNTTASISKLDTPLVEEAYYYYWAKSVDRKGNRSHYSTVAWDTVQVTHWAGNYDGSTEYLSVAPSLMLEGTYSLNETFSDGDYNGWTVSSGTYAVTDTISMYSGLTYALRCATAGIISIPLNQAYGVWVWDWRKGGTTNVLAINIISKVIDIWSTTSDKYGIITYSNENLILQKAGGTTLAASGVSYINDFTTYRDSLIRNTNGSFSLYIKGGTFGDTYTLVSTTGGSGTNPVTDNTYTQSNYFVLDLDAGDAIANIQCQYGSGSLDLNGHEMTKYPYKNSSFENGDTTYWANNGTHSIDTTSEQKQSGSYGAKVIATGVGDSTTNFMSLAATNFTAIESGKKYTAEYWVNAVGKAGTNIIPDSNSSFTTWGLSYWSVGNGSYSHNDSGWVVLNSTTTGYLYKSTYLAAGQTYEVAFSAKSAGYRNKIKFYAGTYVASTSLLSGNISDVWQRFSGKVTYNGSGTLYLQLLGSYSGTVDIDSISVKLYTKPTYTMVIGDKASTSDTISIIPGVFEKVPYTFLATSAEVNTPIKFYLNQADTVYIDNFSITPAWDVTYLFWYKTAYNGVTDVLLSHSDGTSATTSKGYQISLTSAEKASITIYGEGASSFTASSTYGDNIWQFGAITVNRTDSIRYYQDGTWMNSAVYANIGNPNNTSSFAIGSSSYTASGYLTGQVGETQIIRGYAMSQADITENYNRVKYGRIRMKSSYSSGEVVDWWKWKGSNITERLQSAGTGANHLTGTNMTNEDFESYVP